MQLSLPLAAVADQRKNSIGALPARYSFALNQHSDVRFSNCPACESKTRVRKIPLVIHVAGTGLVVLRKTCRMCVNCELVIAHQDEIEPQLAAAVPPGAREKPGYLVLGTVEPRLWRRGLSSALMMDELVENMADFKAHMRLEYTPGGWRPAPKPAAKSPT